MRNRRATLLFAVLLAGGCFSVPALQGHFRCNDNGSCPVAGMVCLDGVCCDPNSELGCDGYVLEGGLCGDGGTAFTFFEDLDLDGVGNGAQTRLYCLSPVFDSYVADGGDCDDRPEVGRLSRPGAPEICDGYDNDCDGVLDEDLPQQTFYRDQDLDGFGDPASPISACALPEGAVTNTLDCVPGNGNAHPGGTEECNGLDDDCNGAVDDNLTDLGQACTVESAYGVCKAGTRVCQAGKVICKSTVAPSLDVCDSKDNDCDNAIDEYPDCTGPKDLLGAPYAKAALNLRANLFGAPTSCLKGRPGAVADVFRSVAGGWQWAGEEEWSHAAYAEAPAGKTWDLSRLAVMTASFSWTITTGAAVGWAVHSQPVVLFCDPEGRFVRLVKTETILAAAKTGSATMAVPPAGGSGWTVAANSSPDVPGVLRRVKRVEILIQPHATVNTPPEFTFTFAKWGFK